MNKLLMRTLAVVVVVATAPVVSFAQERAPVTRAKLKSEIAQLEKFGYSPTDSNIDYPSNLQAAEARIGEAERTAVTTTYGGEVAGTSAAGSHASTSGRMKSPYADRANSLYVGD